MSDIQTRSSDDPKAASRIAAVRREGRKRTMFYSAIVAGSVALFFGWANDHDQRDRSVKNCENAQAIARALAEVAGDVSTESPQPQIKQRWAEYQRTFQRSFPPVGESCDDIFPAVDLIPFF